MSRLRFCCAILVLFWNACTLVDEDSPEDGHAKDEAGANSESDAGGAGKSDSGRGDKLDAQSHAQGDASDDARSHAKGDASDDAQSSTDAAAAGDANGAAQSDAGRDGQMPAGPYLCGQPALGANELLDVGHAHRITALARTGDRVLSHDEDQHWILWDVTSRSRVASGDSASVSLAGTTLVVNGDGKAEVRSATDGGLLASITTVATAHLSSDGGYVWTGSDARLAVWSTDGALRFERPGDYSRAQAHAGPTELRVALGPAGDDVIELISTVDGSASRSSPYAGTFSSWFADGGRFLSRTETALHVYAKTGQEEHVVEPLPPVTELDTLRQHQGGHGDYFWFSLRSTDLELYRVGQQQPLVRQPQYGDFRQMVGGPGFVASVTPLRLYDLRGDTVQVSEPSLDHLPNLRTVALDAEGRWALGDQNGVVVEKSDFASTEAPRVLSCGAVHSVAGSRSGRTAVAVAAGEILVYDLANDGARLLTAFPDASAKVQLSDDGTVLAALSYPQESYSPASGGWLKSIALPSGTELHRWDHAQATVYADFDLSRDGSRIAMQSTQALGQLARSQRDVTSTDGTISYFTGLFDSPPVVFLGGRYPFLLSAKGTFAAFPVPSSLGPTPILFPTPTHVYRDGALHGMVDGLILAWLDDTRMLVHDFDSSDPQGRRFIADADGRELSAARIPLSVRELLPPVLRALDDQRVYGPAHNAIWDIATGTTLWARPLYPVADSHFFQRGDLASEYVVYSAGRKVMFERY